MSRLDKYNRVAFAIITIPVFIIAIMLVLDLFDEVSKKWFLSDDSGFDINQGSISQVESEANAQKEEYSQYISYNSICVLNSEKQEFVIPVVARTMEKPENIRELSYFYNETVDEVVFDDPGDVALTATLATTVSNSNAGGVPVKHIKKPDTTFLKGLRTSQFVNLVYENKSENIHKTLIDKRFTGWELNYIRIGQKSFLAFFGTEDDANKDGYLNSLDQGKFYLYDIGADSLKLVDIPNMEVISYELLRNTSVLILEVKNVNRPKSHKNETFIYRYDINTGKYEDIIPDEEKAQHLKLVQ